ncbi:MAG: hypothetical protein M3Z85_08625, partial [Acidobacteriota bacterium]|nr:hypothetical protein [Acidobacteriota bacterium]
MLEEPQIATLTEWKPLLICPNATLRTEIHLTLGSWLPLTECSGAAEYPAMNAVRGAMLKQERNICFLDVGTDERTAIQI